VAIPSERRIILTFTTIPPRFQHLGPFLDSLRRQRRHPDAVELYVPRVFRRFPGERPSLPSLPDWVQVIEVESDLGPATKILPATRKWRGQDVDLLYLDDDHSFDRRWLERFADARRSHLDDAVCAVGEHLHEVSLVRRTSPPMPRAVLKGHRSRGHRILRAVSRRWVDAPWLFERAGYVDVAMGVGGVVVRPDWFDEQAFEIPEIIWTVDDIWLSGMLERVGRRIWAAPRLHRSRSTVADSFDPLMAWQEGGFSRIDANVRAVHHLRETFGIWEGFLQQRFDPNPRGAT